MGTKRDTPKPDEVQAVIHQFPVGRVRAPKRRGAKPVDRAEVPSGADELNRALQIVDSAREVRADRVAALREQIANGTYSPDPLEVAREILKRGL